MKNRPAIISTLLLVSVLCGMGNVYAQNKGTNLPKPYETPSVTNRSRVIGWPEGKTPVAPKGFTVTKFADGFQNPRWAYAAPNGDVFVADAEANRVYLFRDTNGDGTYESRYVYLANLNRPLGMLVLDGYFYVANNDRLMRYPYDPSATAMRSSGEKIVDLPAGDRHWTRNIVAAPDGSKIYITVGSASNIAENGMDKEYRRANILEVNPDGSGEQYYATGLRNPVGMGWNPVTGELWTVVNERDELGDELVPDYATSLKRGGFYGWPYAYIGANEDPRMKGLRPDLVAKTIVPDILLESHTSTLGMTFYTGNSFPERYRNGLFLVQHGSWNRSELTGYGVKFVPFKNGKPAGNPEDFLTGFIADRDKSEVYGRPVCAVVLSDGSMLITDDGADVIWQISYDK